MCGLESQDSCHDGDMCRLNVVFSSSFFLEHVVLPGDDVHVAVGGLYLRRATDG